MTDSRIINREVQDGGRTLVLQGELPDGRVLTSTVSWADQAEAEAHYADNEAAFTSRMNELAQGVEQGERNSLRILGNIASRQIVLYTSVGGPPWRLPRLRFKVRGGKVNRLEVGAGWLSKCFFIGIGKRGTARV